jgi:hypothetical protein
MIQIGKPPYYECSSKGDKRFSAFYAKVDGISIEEHYQKAKIFKDKDGNYIKFKNIKEAKGKKPINTNEVSILYKKLWKKYLKENPHLIRGLKQQSGLSDMFGQEGHNCQAITLWELRNEL